MNRIIIVHYEEDPDAIDAFENHVEKLWYQHVNYTRQAIISIMGGLEDTAAVIDRLMKNQEDIGNAIIPYYGEAAAAELTGLLKDHITIAGDIFKAIKSGANTTELEAKWQTNAEAIATFLNAADPDNWPYDVALGILNKHLAYTLAEAKARFAKDWVADITAYEDVSSVIGDLAEAFYEGILDKFPEMFVMQYSSKTIKKK